MKNKFRKDIGSFLYYGQSIDTTILMSLSILASKQEKHEQRTIIEIEQFLDYMGINPNETIR